MSEKHLVTSNEAIGYGAIYAGCRHYFGYPITPQNEVTEFFSREMPKIGGVFVQSESESSSICLVLGASAAGVRALTSTSSPGFSLMQEGLSSMSTVGLPGVVVDVQRGGPSMGTTQTAQMDYTQATRGGGHGGYRTIVLAPSSAQETFDLVQLAFYLADKYRTVVIVLSDGLLGQMREPVEFKTLDFGPLPAKNWALSGIDDHGGKKNYLSTGGPVIHPSYRAFLQKLRDLYQEIEGNEVRYETHMLDDAQLVLVAFGSSSRVALEACQMAREEGLPVGVIRPISLWPFPSAIIKECARKGMKFISVEDNMGQMIEDIRLAAGETAQISLVGVFHRHNPGNGGIIYPETVLEEVRKSL